MKNNFNKTKMTLQNQKKQKTQQNEQRKKTTDQLRSEIDRSKMLINKHNKQFFNREYNFKQKFVELNKESFKQKKLLENDEKNHRDLAHKYRKLGQQYQYLNRQNEKDLIVDQGRDNIKNIIILKLKNMIQQKQKIIGQLSCELTQLKESQQQNPFIKKMELENNEIKIKNLFLDKEINVEKNKISEKKFVLDQRNKQRQTQSNLKRDIQLKINNIKFQINQENMLNQQMIAEKVRQKQKNDIQQMERQQKSIDKYLQLFTKRINNFEQNITTMIYQKTDFNQLINDQKEKNKFLLQRINRIENEYIKLITDFEGEKHTNLIYKKELEPLQKQNQRLKQKIKLYQKESNKIQNQIIVFQKQLELIKEIKSLNLDGIQTIKNNNELIQNNISNFIKRWQQIQNRN